VVLVIWLNFFLWLKLEMYSEDSDEEQLLVLLRGKFDVHVRITTEVSNFLELYGDVFDGSKSLVVCEKQGTVEQHYHAYITSLKYETLRSRLKKYFSGNGEYATLKVNEHSKETQLTYLCKGTETSYPVVVLNTLGVNTFMRWRSFWSDRSDFKAVVKERKRKAKDFKSMLLERVRATKDPLNPTTYVSYYNIYMVCMELCKEIDKLPPGDYLMISYMEYVRLQEGDVEQTDKFERILRRLLPSRD